MELLSIFLTAFFVTVGVYSTLRFVWRHARPPIREAHTRKERIEKFFQEKGIDNELERH